MTIEVYTKPSCGGCIATKQHLTKLGLTFTEHVLDETILDTALGHGILSAPVVVIDGGEMWGGYRPDRIKALVNS